MVIWIIILGKTSTLNFVWDIASNSGNFWKFQEISEAPNIPLWPFNDHAVTVSNMSLRGQRIQGAAKIEMS